MDQVKASVVAVLQQMAERYAAGDPEGVLELFAGEDSVIVGTGADEVRFGLAEIRRQIERDMAQADSISMEFGDVKVRVAGEAAFAYAAAAFAGSVGDQDFKLPVRMTASLVRTGDAWRIAQFHVSVAYGEQTEGQSFPS